MKKTTNLNPERSEKYRYLDKFSYGPKLIALCSIAIIVSMLSLLMAWMAVYDAIHARADVASQAIHIEQLSDDVATYRFQISVLSADLKAKGYEPVEEEQ